MHAAARRHDATAVIPTLSILAAILLCAAPLSARAATPDGGGGATTSLLVKCKVDLTPDVVASIAARQIQVRYVWPEIRAMAITMNAAKLGELTADPRIDRVEPDLWVHGPEMPAGDEGAALEPQATPSAATTITTWNQDMADTPGSGLTGSGVTVAVVDAGLPQNWSEFLPAGHVDLTHATGFGAEGWGDYHNDPKAIPGQGGYIGLFPHGLAVSSVIVGFPSEFGFVGGAAPGATILPVRVLNSFNYGQFSWFAAAMLYVGNLKASGAIPGPLVINFSIQAYSNSPILADAIDYAISRGVLFVTIAGNFNPDAYVSFPGRLPESITAGAAGWRSEGIGGSWFFGDVPENDPSQVYVAPFSGRESPYDTPGSQVDVLAPGAFVFGEWLEAPGFSEGRESAPADHTFHFIFGTSFAAPHVVGIVAQMLEKNPSLTQSEAEGILRSTALPIPPAGGFVTPLGFPVLPWDARATGAGLARGAAAVAATPASAARIALGAVDARGAARVAGRGALSVRLLSPPGRLPVAFGLGGHAGGALVSVFDATGRLVRRWSEPAGATRGAWDGSRAGGETVGSGVYFMRVEAAGGLATAKVVVAR